MAGRVTTFKAGVLMAGGSTRVSAFHAGIFTSNEGAARVSRLSAGIFASDKTVGPRITRLHAGVFANDKTNGPRITRFHAGIFANDKTNGPVVTAVRVGFWGSLDQGLWLTAPTIGSNEVFKGSIRNHIIPVEPALPEVDANPYRAEVPNVDLQRILREQHNVTQAGDSTFPWGLLADINAEPLYNLGSLGKFYHDDLGIIEARYCKLVDWADAVTAATPVGLRRSPLEPWTVTNRLELSDPDAVQGISLPYNKSILDGVWYGWVVVTGFLPVELNFEQVDFDITFDMEYGWSSTGHVKPGLATTSVGKRYSDSNNIRLKPGQFKVEIDTVGKLKTEELIRQGVQKNVDDLIAAIVRIESLESDNSDNKAAISANAGAISALDKRLVRDMRNINTAIRGIRRTIGATAVTKSYVDIALNNIRAEVIERVKASDKLSIKAYETADQAMRIATGGLGTDFGTQVDNLNAALGELNNRLIGFTVRIYDPDNPVALKEHDALVATEVGVNGNGLPIFEFVPKPHKVTGLADVKAIPGPANGQTIVWDSAEGLFKFRAASGGGGGGGGGVGFAEVLETRVIAATQTTADANVFELPEDSGVYRIRVTSEGGAALNPQIALGTEALAWATIRGSRWGSGGNNLNNSGTALLSLNASTNLGTAAWSQEWLLRKGSDGRWWISGRIGAGTVQGLNAGVTGAPLALGAVDIRSTNGSGFVAGTEIVVERIREEYAAGGGGGAGGLYDFAIPKLAEFPVVAKTLNVVDSSVDTDTGLIINVTKPSANLANMESLFRMREVTGDFTAIVGFVKPITLDYIVSGLILRNAANDKAIAFGYSWWNTLTGIRPALMRTTGAIDAAVWTHNGDVTNNVITTADSGPRWVRVTKTSTTLSFAFSYDRLNWCGFAATDEAISGHLGAVTHIGLGALLRQNSTALPAPMKRDIKIRFVDFELIQ